MRSVLVFYLGLAEGRTRERKTGNRQWMTSTIPDCVVFGYFICTPVSMMENCKHFYRMSCNVSFALSQNARDSISNHRRRRRRLECTRVLSVLASASHHHHRFICSFHCTSWSVLTRIFFTLVSLFSLCVSVTEYSSAPCCCCSTKSMEKQWNETASKRERLENKSAQQNVSKPIWHLSHTLFSLKLQTLHRRCQRVWNQ